MLKVLFHLFVWRVWVCVRANLVIQGKLVGVFPSVMRIPGIELRLSDRVAVTFA